MIQQIIVTVIVAYAAWVVLKRYAPKSLRLWARTRGAQAAKRAGWNRLSAKLAAEPQAAASCGDSCGPCKGCGSADTVAQSTVTPVKLQRLHSR